MPFATKEMIERARQIDVLTYLQNYDPGELVNISPGNYCTRTHDSLKISNGKWYWFSRGIGGTSAIDYLIAAYDMTFPQAVEAICGAQIKSPACIREQKIKERKPFVLPNANENNKRAFAYLSSRGIGENVLQHCIKNGLIYEDQKYHNAVFIGKDKGGTAKYANLRSTQSNSTFMQDVEGSHKEHCFCIRGEQTDKVYVFECAIDALSAATMMSDADFKRSTFLSLGGVFGRKEQLSEAKTPAALLQYLEDYPQTKCVVLCLDNDDVGKIASQRITENLKETVQIIVHPPSEGKDYNEKLQIQKGITSKVAQRGKSDNEGR